MFMHAFRNICCLAFEDSHSTRFILLYCFSLFLAPIVWSAPPLIAKLMVHFRPQQEVDIMEKSSLISFVLHSLTSMHTEPANGSSIYCVHFNARTQFWHQTTCVPNHMYFTFWMHCVIVQFARSKSGGESQRLFSTSMLANDRVRQQLIYSATKTTVYWRCSTIAIASLLSHLQPCLLLRWVSAIICDTKWQIMAHYHLQLPLCDLGQHVKITTQRTEVHSA